jgi:epoxyqueuosine reductase
MQAGLGIIRKNNFFYTENGSWVHLEAWLIDKALEWKETNQLPECSDSCSLCIQACPTESLCDPYAMDRSSCISFVTTWGGRSMPEDRNREKLGKWIYGCDICQDVCPYNKNKWVEESDFPGLDDLAQNLTLEKIVEMDYETLQANVYPKFWYVPKQDAWKWKVNALNSMLNSGDSKYVKWFRLALNDEQKKVREMAEFALSQASSTDKPPSMASTII